MPKPMFVIYNSLDGNGILSYKFDINGYNLSFSIRAFYRGIKGSTVELIIKEGVDNQIITCESAVDMCSSYIIEVYSNDFVLIDRFAGVSNSIFLNTSNYISGIYHIRLLKDDMVIDTEKLVIK